MITWESIAKGIRNTKWRYRLEEIKSGDLKDILPQGSKFYIDGAHNISGARVLANFIKQEYQHDMMPSYIINGRTKDTDSFGFLSEFRNIVKKVFTVRVELEALPESPYVIAREAKRAGLECDVSSSIKDAIETIASLEQNPVRVIICGSLYLAKSDIF